MLLKLMQIIETPANCKISHLFLQQLEEVENMRCPDLLTVSWVEIPPYIYNTTEGKLDGIFYNILTQMVQFCCPDRTNLSFAENPVTLTKFQGILDNGTDDILLPAYGTGKKKDRLGEPFISLGKQPLLIMLIHQCIFNEKNAGYHISDIIFVCVEVTVHLPGKNLFYLQKNTDFTRKLFCR